MRVTARPARILFDLGERGRAGGLYGRLEARQQQSGIGAFHAPGTHLGLEPSLRIGAGERKVGPRFAQAGQEGVEGRALCRQVRAGLTLDGQRHTPQRRRQQRLELQVGMAPRRDGQQRRGMRGRTRWRRRQRRNRLTGREDDGEEQDRRNRQPDRLRASVDSQGLHACHGLTDTLSLGGMFGSVSDTSSTPISDVWPPRGQGGTSRHVAVLGMLRIVLGVDVAHGLGHGLVRRELHAGLHRDV